jgi:hypothetical protein
MPNITLNRRSFLLRLGSLMAPLALAPAPLRALMATGSPTLPTGVHPEPRPGVDGSRVLPSDQVAPHAADLFDRIRAIPGVVDGIRCHCGCAELDGMYSLLSCYEGVGMAQFCEVCSGEGALVARLAGAGLSLNAIREEIDRRYG